MGFRIRKILNLGGGFRVNLSRSGPGLSWGFPGFRLTRTANGRTRRTYSIPGTGISYVDEGGNGARGSVGSVARTVISVVAWLIVLGFIGWLFF